MKPKYPITKETIHQYAENVFSPISRGDCVTTVWVPMAGRRKHTNFIINNIDLFKNELPDYQNYILVYVDPLDLTEEGKTGYLRLIGKNFLEAVRKNVKADKLIKTEVYTDQFNDDNISYSKMLDLVRELFLKVADNGLEIVLFLGEFDELDHVSPIFFGNLKSLWIKLDNKLHYVFLILGRATKPENIKLWGEELSEIIFHNLIYRPLLSNKDINYILDLFASEFNFKYSAESKKIVEKLCGGHPYMLKVASQALAALKSDITSFGLEKVLLDNQELTSISIRIYKRQIERDRLLLEKMAKGKGIRLPENEDSVDFLSRMGIIYKDSKGKYHLFSSIFKKAIQNYVKDTADKTENVLRMDDYTKRVMIGNKPAEDSFSQQELVVIKHFLTAGTDFISRDRIAKVIWGEKSEKKYSNWAIDQLVSKLRKKFKDLLLNAEIVTLRGEGYKFYLAPKSS